MFTKGYRTNLVSQQSHLPHNRQSFLTVSRVAVCYEVTTVTQRKELPVFERQRPTPKELDLLESAEDCRIQKMTKAFWLPKHLAGSPSATWLEPLRLFEHRLTSEANSSWFASKPSETVFNLRKYYPDDKVLMDFTNFVEAAVADDPATTFKSEYRRVMIPRSTDGSFKVF